VDHRGAVLGFRRDARDYLHVFAKPVTSLYDQSRAGSMPPFELRKVCAGSESCGRLTPVLIRVGKPWQDWVQSYSLQPCLGRSRVFASQSVQALSITKLS
jgi:hypothetical protein